MRLETVGSRVPRDRNGEARRPAEPGGDDFSRVEHVERVDGVRWGEASRRAAKKRTNLKGKRK